MTGGGTFDGWGNPTPTRQPSTDNRQRFGAMITFSLHKKLDILWPLRQWIDGLEICDRNFAHLICQLIPGQCPFERNITLLLGWTLHIPPLCKLNPLYDELVSLRFRALTYLADVCGEQAS